MLKLIYVCPEAEARLNKVKEKYGLKSIHAAFIFLQERACVKAIEGRRNKCKESM